MSHRLVTLRPAVMLRLPPARHLSRCRLRTASRRVTIGMGAFVVGSVAILGAVGYQIRDFNKRLSSGKDGALSERTHRYIYVTKSEPTSQEQHWRKSDRLTSLAESVSNKLLFPWLQSRSHDPGVLLRLAQCDDHAVRLMGVKALADDHDWSDGEYQRVAQAIDGRTVVGLARTAHADKRLFLPPPPLPQSKVSLGDELRELISKLPLDHLDKCTKYFTQKAMQDCPESKKLERGVVWHQGGYSVHMASQLSKVPPERAELLNLDVILRHSTEFVWSVDGHGIYVEPSKSALDRMLVYSLRALIDFSYLPSHCSKIVKEGGLAILQRVYEARQGSTKILRCIALIMANLALHEHLHADIISAGWVGILHEWMDAKDLELSVKAAKALANLDVDFGREKKYMEGVYLYHPQTRFSEPVYADIVFVHGLLGGPFRTWRQKDPVKVVKAKQQQQQQQQQQRVDNHSNDTPHSAKPSSVSINSEARKTSSPKDTCPKCSKPTPSSSQNSDSAEAISLCKCDENKLMSRDSGKPEVKQLLHLDKFDVRKVDPKQLFGLRGHKEKSGERRPDPYTFCWPRDWLGRDIPNARILSVGYETYLNEWEAECPYESEKRALFTRSFDMLEKLRKAGIGDRPVIWVGHSMGGLLIKQMLVNARHDLRYKRMVEQSKGVVFYSVPHRGSQLANYAKKVKHIYAPSVEVKELVTGCPKLQELHNKFTTLIDDTHVPVLSFAEGRETLLPFKFKLVIVPEESCDPGFGEFHVMADLTHLNICKPASRDSAIYRLTLHFLRECVPFGRVKNILRASLNDSTLSDDLQ